MANKAICALTYGDTHVFTLPYGECSTAAGTAAKVVAVQDGKFALEKGARVCVKFTVTNTASNPTLNVSSTGAKSIMYRGSAINKGYLAANRIYEFVYDGTDWELIGDIDTNSTGYLPLSGGNLSGHVYLTGAQENSSTANTSQIVFGTSSNNHVAISSNNNAVVINPSTNATTNQIVLYLDQPSSFPSGISGNASSASTVAVTNTTPTSATTYYPLYATGVSGNQTVRANTDLYYYDTGTASYFNVGSSTNIGGLTLHHNNGKYVNLIPASITANRNITLPNVDGTIITTGNLPSGYVQYKVGDTITTTRTDLDDSWKVCDGTVVKRADYPALGATGGMLLKPTGYSYTVSKTFSAGGIAYANGSWVCAGRDSSYGRVYVWGSDVSNPPSLIQSDSKYTWCDIAYGNGIWAAIGKYSGTPDITYLLYTTNPNGTWTKKNINSSIPYNSSTSYKIKYINNRWFVIYKKTLYTSTDILSDNWASVAIDGLGVTAINDIEYGNGVYVLVGQDPNSTASTGGYAPIFTATSPTGPWTANSSFPLSSSLNSVKYSDGKWVAVGNLNQYSNNYATGTIILYTTNPTGTWSENVENRKNHASCELYKVDCIKGVWITMGGNTSYDFLMKSTNTPSGIWSSMHSDDIETNVNSIRIEDFAVNENGEYVAVGYINSDTTSIIYTNQSFALPKISSPSFGLETYIKVK